MGTTKGSKPPGKRREITLKERWHLDFLLNRCGFTQAAAALALGRTQGCISKEVKRGLVEQRRGVTVVFAYSAEYAQICHERAVSKRGCGKKIGNDCETAAVLVRLLKQEHHSPYAAVMRARKEGSLKTQLCPKTVYNYIHDGTLGVGPDVLVYGARGGKKEKAPFAERADDMRGDKSGLSIETRPKAVLSREEFGHWEGDLVESARPGKSSLFTLLERKTRFLIVVQLEDKTQRSVATALDDIEAFFGSAFNLVFLSLTLDNGMCFADPAKIRRSFDPERRDGTGCGGRFDNLYYAHPYCSSERGSNENANRMVRRFFPKKASLDDPLYTQEYALAAEAWINGYPRAIFGGASSAERFREEMQKAITAANAA